MTTLTTASADASRSLQHVDDTPLQAADPAWKSLYRVGGVASLLLVLIIPLQLVVFMIAPPQTTVEDWYALFLDNSLLGLLAFELLMIVYVILSIPVSLALYGALRRASPPLAALFIFLSLMGGVLLIIARPAFEMLALSQDYAAATTGEQRMILLAAGEATMAAFDGTAYLLSYVLGSLSGLILAAVMLKSRLFGRAAAYLRIASAVLDFGLFIPVIGLYVSIFSVVFLWIFNMLVAWKLFRLGRAVFTRQAS